MAKRTGKSTRRKRRGAAPPGRKRRRAGGRSRSPTARVLLGAALLVAVVALVGLAVRGVRSLGTGPPDPAHPPSGSTTGHPRVDKGYAGPPKKLFRSAKVEGGMHHYEAWAAGIELPRVELSAEPLALDRAGKLERFLPDYVDRDRLELFYLRYDELDRWARKELGGAGDAEYRGKVVATFAGNLTRSYHETFEDPEDLEGRPVNVSWTVFREINRVLIPSDRWIGFQYTKTRGLKLVLHEIDAIHLAVVRLGGTRLELPVLLLKNRMELSAGDEEKRVDIIAKYFPKERYICVDRDWTDEKAGAEVGPTGTAEELLHANIAHEAEHAALYEIVGLDLDDARIGGEGAVHMGTWLLEPDDYRWHNLFELHELGGVGIEVMHLDESAPRRLTTVIGTVTAKDTGLEYALAAYVALHEVGYALETERRRRLVDAFFAQAMSINELEEAIRSIPREQLRRIGERMAKLAHHLATRE